MSRRIDQLSSNYEPAFVDYHSKGRDRNGSDQSYFDYKINVPPRRRDASLDVHPQTHSSSVISRDYEHDSHKRLIYHSNSRYFDNDSSRFPYHSNSRYFDNDSPTQLNFNTRSHDNKFEGFSSHLAYSDTRQGETNTTTHHSISPCPHSNSFGSILRGEYDDSHDRSYSQYSDKDSPTKRDYTRSHDDHKFESSNSHSTYTGSVTRYTSMEKSSRDFDEKPVNKYSQPIRGICNLGGTCYLNSALQCLIRAEELCEVFLSEVSIRGDFAEVFQKFVREMHEKYTFTSVFPFDIKKAIERLHPQFSGIFQQDIGQILTIMVSELDNDLQLPENVKNQLNKDETYSSESSPEISKSSIIQKIFFGMLSSTLICCDCNKEVSSKNEPFSVLHMPLPQESYVKINTCVIDSVELKYEIYEISVLVCSVYTDIADELKSKGISLDSTNKMFFANYNKRDGSFTIVKSLNDKICTEEDNVICVYRKTGHIDGKNVFLLYIECKGYPNIPPLLRILENYNETTDRNILTAFSLPHENFIQAYKNPNKEDSNFNEVKLEYLRPPFGRIKPISLTSDKKLDLKQCIEKFLIKERMTSDTQIFCPTCNRQTEVYKRFAFVNLPDVLFIYLKRYTFLTFISEKIDTFIQIPMNDMELHQQDEPQTVHYDLIAVANHYGTLKVGHYTTFAKCGEEWLLFDDSRVRKMTFEDLNMKHAILLMYRKNMCDVMQEE